VRLDPKRRQVIVGPRGALQVNRIRIDEVNWLGDRPLKEDACGGLPLFIRVRSTRPPRPATLFATADGAEVDLVEGEEGVAPGQACVMYDSDDPRARLLGGGVIKGTVGAGATIRTEGASALAAAS